MDKRPSDPSKISFADHCFETVGTIERYSVAQSALQPGPATFSDRAQAEAFARKRGRTVHVYVVPDRRRVRWY